MSKQFEFLDVIAILDFMLQVEQMEEDDNHRDFILEVLELIAYQNEEIIEMLEKKDEPKKHIS